MAPITKKDPERKPIGPIILIVAAILLLGIIGFLPGLNMSGSAPNEITAAVAGIEGQGTEDVSGGIGAGSVSDRSETSNGSEIHSDTDSSQS